MNTLILLEEKWKVQKELSKKSGYDLKKYTELIDTIMDNLIKKNKKGKKHSGK